MRDIIICDFNDSFTFNVYAEIKLQFPKAKVSIVDHQDFLALTELESKLIILGPGPGHPDEYFHILKFLKENFSNQDFRFFGVCLGHQLIWRSLGAEVKRSSKPVHGQKSLYKGFKGPVQRYNSLGVLVDVKKVKNYSTEYLYDGDELIFSKGNKFISYQFHPESVGTTCPEKYFQPLKQLLL